MENTLRMRSILWQKACSFVEAHSLSRAVKPVLTAFIVGIISGIATAPDTASYSFDSLIEWRNHMIPVTFWIAAIAFYGKTAITWFLDLFAREEECSDAFIEGIPVTDLVDHLVSRKTFRRDDIESLFGVPRYRYTALAKKLKELGVLESGINNMSVLGEEWNREKLIELIDGAESAEDLEKSITIVRPIPSPPLFSRKRITEETATESHAKPMGSLCATA